MTSSTNGLMQGKRGLIMGLANDKSLAWGIAQKLAEHGAELAFSYQGEALEKRVRPLAEQLGSDFLLRLRRVATWTRSTRPSTTLQARWETIDFVVHAIGFSDKNELRGKYRRHQPRQLPDDDEHLGLSLVAVTQRARPMMPNGGSDPDADLLRRREGRAALQRDGRGQGGARDQRQVSRQRPRAREHPRQRDLAPGRSRRWRRAGSATSATSSSGTSSTAPLRRNVTIEDVGGAGLYLLSRPRLAA